jgi:NAD(P)-dependent dehydrogenase (short-subunit alcohol dehydrogenase family)
MGTFTSLASFPLLVLVLRYALHYGLRTEYKVHESGGILVTGASSGIGEHAAISLANKGYTVFAGCRKDSDVDRLNNLGIAKLKPIVMDVTKQETIDSGYDLITKELGGEPFIALVNNAGIAKNYPVELMDIDRDARANFEVNYFGVIAGE